MVNVVNGALVVGPNRVPLCEVDRMEYLDIERVLVFRWGADNEAQYRVSGEEAGALFDEWSDANLAAFRDTGVLRSTPLEAHPLQRTEWCLVGLSTLAGVMLMLGSALSPATHVLMACRFVLFWWLVFAVPITLVRASDSLATRRAHRHWTRLEITFKGITGWDHKGRCHEQPWSSIRVVNGVVFVGGRVVEPWTMKRGLPLARLAYGLAEVNAPRPTRALGVCMAVVLTVASVVLGLLEGWIWPALVGVPFVYVASQHALFTWKRNLLRRHVHDMTNKRLPGPSLIRRVPFR